LAHHAAWLRRLTTDDAFAAAMAADYTTATLADADRALCDYAAKLTRTPWDMVETDLAPLRAAGFSDRAIHDACAVAGYFAFANRLIAGLGVELEPEHLRGPDSPS
jgi:uncharacterized peroxidase-related enzyme